MAFYIDSADHSLIEELWVTGVFQGVTTNPTILYRAGLDHSDLPDLYAWLMELGVETFYAQVIGTSTEAMLTSAESLRSLGPIVVKVPATFNGVKAARILVQDGARVLLTAVYHPVQALLARDLGVHGVAPYVGRMTDAGRPGLEAVLGMQQAIGAEPTRILAASLRSPDDIASLAAAGIPDFTVGEAVARTMLDDDLTVRAVEEFESATASGTVDLGVFSA